MLNAINTKELEIIDESETVQFKPIATEASIRTPKIPKFNTQLFLFQNEQIPSEYIQEIYDYLLRTEGKYWPENKVFADQPEVNEKMRAMMVDWIIEVHYKFKLVPQTLFLVVNLVDRYLSHKKVPRKKFQLIGTACFLVACKFEEIYSPELRDFCFICDQHYKQEEIIQYEYKVLAAVDFDINFVSSYRFLEIFAIQFEVQDSALDMAKYCVELALLDTKFYRYPPSLIALASTFIGMKAFKNTREKELLKILKHEGKNSELKFRECVKLLIFWIENVDKTQYSIVKSKFASSKFNEVGKFSFLS